MPSNKAPSSSLDFIQASTLLKALAHPARLSIMQCLLREKEMNVSSIVEAQKGLIGQSQTSQFLTRLRREGLLQTRKRGQTVYYSIRSDAAAKLTTEITKIFQ